MGSEILQGWKSIAGYLERDERTVRRWEKLHGLPVRRMPGGSRGIVYAVPAELDRWLLEPRSEPAEPAVNDPNQESAPAASAESQPEPVPALESKRPAAQPKLRKWRRWPVAAAVAGLALLGLASLGARSLHRRAAGGPVAVVRPPAANDATLRAEFLLEQRTPSALDHALHAFEEETARHPGNAAAFTGLAKTYCLLREYSTMPSSEAYPRAEAAAARALALDPGLADAHAVMGFVDFFWKWQPGPAEAEFRRGIALDPRSSLAHFWYGSMLTHQGRGADALAELAEAQRLQPTSSAILALRAYALLSLGRRAEGEELLTAVMADAPGAPSPHQVMAALAVAEPRKPDRYLEEMRRFTELQGDTTLLGDLRTAEAALRTGGEPAMWRALLRAQRRRPPGAPGREYRMAQMEALLGDRAGSVALLEGLVARHDALVSGLCIDPHFASLQGEPRFQALLHRVGLAG